MKALFEVKPKTAGAPKPSHVVHLDVPDAETARRLEQRLKDEDATIGAAGARFSLRSVHKDIENASSYQDAAQKIRDAILASE